MLGEPSIILGPPGTGKTTTLLGMVERELQEGTPPERIGYLSFTRRAAEEAISRASEKFNLERSRFPYFRTLHSLCFRALGLSSSEVLEGKRLEEFGNLVGYKITGRFSLDEGTTFGFEKGDRILFMEHLARSREVPLEVVYNEDDDGLSLWEVKRFAEALAQYKRDLGIVDFTDMLLSFVSSNIRIGLDVLFVDEAQDLSKLQWDVVRKLSENVRQVVIAGDDDQALYRWSGADVETLITMPGRVRVLERSWRVPRAVQEVAASVVDRIRNRREKTWHPRDEDGLVKRHTSWASIDLSGPDILILARNRYLLREFESVLKAMGYLYEFQGARSIRPKLLDAVLTWERLRQGKTGVTVQQARKMYEFMSANTSIRRGYKTLPDLPDDQEIDMRFLVENGGLLVDPKTLWYDALDRMSLVEVSYIRAARRRGENLLAPPRIRLSTIHGMKGGEADQVVLMTDMAARTFEQYRRNPEDEHRVWYVAVTRARRELHIIAPSTTKNYIV